MTTLPICCVTGRIAGDSHACGDCDPCGAAHAVPDVVKALLRERDEWATKYSDAMGELDQLRPTPHPDGHDLLDNFDRDDSWPESHR
jgi:hypothetical protein